jgi:hypothetical protein
MGRAVERAKRGSLGRSKFLKFGATLCNLRCCNCVICPITLGKETMTIPEEDQHNNKGRSQERTRRMSQEGTGRNSLMRRL